MNVSDLAGMLALSWQGEILPDGTTDYVCVALGERLARMIPADRLQAWKADPRSHQAAIEQSLTALVKLDPIARDLARRLDGPRAGPAAPAQSGGGGRTVSIQVGERNQGIVTGGDVHIGSFHSGGPQEAVSATAAPVQEKRAEPEPVRILFLSANPREQTRLALDREVHEIDDALQKARLGHRFDLRTQWAVRAADVQEYLLRHQPDILHFSGHGEEGLQFEGMTLGSGRALAVSGEALARTLACFRPKLRCVVLNACHSEAQAVPIAEVIDCVIGTSESIGDAKAAAFSAAFYRALANGMDVATAFELGCADLHLIGIDIDRKLRLHARCPVSFIQA